jgi:lambda family phage portal protein
MANPFRRAIAPKPGNAGRRNAFGMSALNRLTSDWVMAASRSADGELRNELRTMRMRSRELVRNSPFGVRYHQLMAENVVGPVGRTGFQLCAQNYKKGTEELHDAANTAIEEEFSEYARPVNCDVAGKLTLGEMLCLAASSWGTDGEILVRIYRGKRFGPYGIQFQLIDPDFLIDDLNQVAMGNVPAINQGIEQDEYGKPTFYHLWTRHPYDKGGRFLGLGAEDRIKVPASDIIHAFIPMRAGQSRGIPHSAAIAATLKMLDGYVEAELVAARIASATMAAIEDLPNGEGPAVSPNTGSGDVDGEDGSQAFGAGAIPTEVEPGAMLDLRGKGKLALWDPQHPTSAFPTFTRMMSHYAAIGFGISYGTLTGDLSQANYGSLRVGMLDERQHWQRYQLFMIEHVVDRMFREWLAMVLLNNTIPLLTDKAMSRWTRVQWMGRGFDWIDPLKDAQGDLMEVAAGTNTLTLMAAKRGRDLEQMVQQRAREIKLFAKYGVPCTLVATAPAAPPAEKDESGETTNAPADAAEKSWDGGLPVVPITQPRPLRAVGT